MQAVAPEILIKRHPALPLIHFLTRHIVHVLIALILQIAQMARRFKIRRRFQNPIEEAVGVEEED